MNREYFQDFFNDFVQLAGELSGQPVRVERPDYETPNYSEGEIIAPRKIYKVERTTNRLAQPTYTNLELYAVFGDRSLIQAGDVLIPLDPKSTTPIVTLVNISDQEECLGFRTNRIGAIRNGTKDLFTNVRFDFVGEGFPASPLEREIKTSLEIPTKKINIFTRDLDKNNLNEVYDNEGLLFIETDIEEQTRWRIETVDEIGNLMVLICKEATTS